ncbi:MAG TPA: hypothetical protein VNI60_10830 [Pyrinomonadaceae bacterium]|nr:hypothetical protein [Pyrinomonadaceae bacterium]
MIYTEKEIFKEKLLKVIEYCCFSALNIRIDTDLSRHTLIVYVMTNESDKYATEKFIKLFPDAELIDESYGQIPDYTFARLTLELSSDNLHQMIKIVD